MDDIIFYLDSMIGKEIAFVLGITYEYVNEIKKIYNKCLFIQNDNDIENALNNGLVRGEDFISFDELYEYMDIFVRDKETVNRREPYTRDLEEINKIENYNLYLTEMLIKVLFSKPKDINCHELTTKYNIDTNGNLWGCCPGWIEKPFGNILEEINVDDNYFARIIKLSQINKTFCFCNLNRCRYYGKPEIEYTDLEFNAPKYPEQLTVSVDRVCNLRCNSCRKNFFIPTKEQKKFTEMVTDKLIESDVLNHTDVLLAGQGEVFYSENYLKILNSLKKTDKIKILSNGNLLNEEKWNLLYPRFKEIHISISIDAFNKDTYIKLRHGDYDQLMKNLDMLSILKKEGKIEQLWFNFVVQRDNMYEMIDFVKFAKEHNVDRVQFTKLNDWRVMSREEYLDKCLIIDNNYLDYDLYKILQDPIFKEDFVDIEFFNVYMDNSKKVYG